MDDIVRFETEFHNTNSVSTRFGASISTSPPVTITTGSPRFVDLRRRRPVGVAVPVRVIKPRAVRPMKTDEPGTDVGIGTFLMRIRELPSYH